ncbi:hypothetical protein FDECE_16196 [Fusarium decemcellulare]|nr:hypothetical protein FDECE_16196 [Fusarium decemcellulare]
MALGLGELEAPRGATSRGRIVVLNGFPGTGKLTILKNLEAQLDGQDIRVIDSHLTMDPMQSVYPDKGLNHYYLRRQLREVYFGEIRRIASQGCLVLMTTCLVGNVADHKVLDEYLNMVRGTGIPMIWVNVHCEQRILEERVTSPGRAGGTKSKLTDVHVLRQVTEGSRLITPRSAGHKIDGVDLVTARLDVSGRVEEAVDKVSAVIGRERLRQ